MDAEIRDTIAALFPPGQVIEVRAITEEGMASGYFNDFEALAAAVEPLDSTNGTQGIYVTLNEVNPALLSRRANRIKGRLSKKDATTADSDIIRRRWFPIDIDPVRPSGVSATGDEHERALERADRVAAFLSEKGFPAPIRGDSGNGAHLLYRVDLPNDAHAMELVKRCLEVLDVLFSDAHAKIDTAIFNAARIWKLYGTISRKGDHTPERPHRRSHLLAVPDRLEVADEDLLRHLATSLPSSPAETKSSPRKSLDLREWLRTHGLGVETEKPYQGGTLFVLEECPFSGAHRDGAFAIQFGNGAIYAGCHHAGCGGGIQRWRELRERFEKRKNNPDPSPLPPRAEVPENTKIRDEALAVLYEDDPLAFMLRSFALDHVGDETVATCLIMSLASQSVINTNGLHVSVTGESGKGKSHTFVTMLKQVPERFRLKGAMSNKALYYLDDMQPGSVIVLDDTTLSDEVQEILKSATTSFREPIEYRTVTKERRVRVCTIPERCVWWVAKVEGSGDDQVLNRMLTCWIDDSREQDERVLERILGKDEAVPATVTGERHEVLVCQALWDILRSQRWFVVIPFARRIRFSHAENRRNPEMLLDLIKAHALLRCMQREQTEADDRSPCIIATRDDFQEAVRLYDQLNGTAGGQETKLTKVEAALLDVIARAEWPEFTVQQLQSVTGRSSSSIRKILHGYMSKGYSYSGLLEKCPAISYTDRTVVTNDEEGLSVRRRTTAYQFSPDLYRQWARGGSCWLELGDDHNDDNHEAEERKRAEGSRKNSAQINEQDSEQSGGIAEGSLSVHNNEWKIPGREQQEGANGHADLFDCDTEFSAHYIGNQLNEQDSRNSLLKREDFPGGNPGKHSALSSLPPPIGKVTRFRSKASDFKKLEDIKRGVCSACGGKKYLPYIEKLTERRRKLPPNEPPYHLCKECYQEAVQRERSSSPPLPGMIDVDRLERVTSEIGRCSVCGLEKAEWIDRERGIKICQGCWDDLIREKFK
ncbi:MAG: hypothetical protein QHH04_05170 [Methanolinea sp.]|jgi:hypothetical protein|nr:hypothetical protein [Methanolinea sp.]